MKYSSMLKLSLSVFNPFLDQCMWVGWVGSVYFFCVCVLSQMRVGCKKTCIVFMFILNFPSYLCVSFQFSSNTLWFSHVVVLQYFDFVSRLLFIVWLSSLLCRFLSFVKSYDFYVWQVLLFKLSLVCCTIFVFIYYV